MGSHLINFRRKGKVLQIIFTSVQGDILTKIFVVFFAHQKRLNEGRASCGHVTWSQDSMLGRRLLKKNPKKRLS